MYVDVLPESMSVYHMHAPSCGRGKRALDSLELELQTAVSQYVDAEN